MCCGNQRSVMEKITFNIVKENKKIYLNNIQKTIAVIFKKKGI